MRISQPEVKLIESELRNKGFNEVEIKVVLNIIDLIFYQYE